MRELQFHEKLFRPVFRLHHKAASLRRVDVHGWGNEGFRSVRVLAGRSPMNFKPRRQKRKLVQCQVFPKEHRINKQLRLNSRSYEVLMVIAAQ